MKKTFGFLLVVILTSFLAIQPPKTSRAAEEIHIPNSPIIKNDSLIKLKETSLSYIKEFDEVNRRINENSEYLKTQDDIINEQNVLIDSLTKQNHEPKFHTTYNPN